MVGQRTEREGVVKKFLPPPVGECDPGAHRGARRQLLKAAQILIVAAKDFVADRCLLEASALSFTTILSLVPFLALAFAILKGFGVQNRLEPFLLQQVTAGSEVAVSKIIHYINNTKMTSLGTIGLVSLIITVVSLFASIEESFNTIWGVTETRSTYRKFTDYLSVSLVAPILMLSATSVTTSLQSQTLVQWVLYTEYLGPFLLFWFHIVPYLIVWIALIFFYMFIPNTKVRFKSALIGGVLAGTIWQLAQWGYIHFQVGVARYNAIYGTLALLPLIMVWIYTSWVIVLFGGEVVCAHQTLRGWRGGLRLCASHALHEYLTLSVFRQIAAAFLACRPAWDAEGLAEKLDVPTRTIRELLSFFVTRGFLAEGAGEPTTYLPAKDIESISVIGLLSALRGYGGEGCDSPEFVRNDAVFNLLDRVRQEMDEILDGMTIGELAKLSQSDAGGDADDIDKGPGIGI